MCTLSAIGLIVGVLVGCGGTHAAPMRSTTHADIPAFENVADMRALPPRGALVIALPMKIRGGSGGPLRIVAALPACTPGWLTRSRR